MIILKRQKNTASFFAVVYFAIFFNSCSPSVMLQLQRPAEVNLTKYKKIAISEFANPKSIDNYSRNGERLIYTNFNMAGTELADIITSKIFESNKYEIVDRQNLDKILSEQKLSAQGFIEENSTIELGGLLGASAIIVGHVITANFKELPIQSQNITTKEGKKHTIYTRFGNMDFKANIKFIDATTSKIIALKNIDVSQPFSTQAYDKYPENINAEAIYNNKKNLATDIFMKMIAPYTITKFIDFETDKQMPELKNYIAMLETQNYEIALKGLEELADRNFIESKIKAKALYNYAITTTYLGNPDKGVVLLNEANRIMPAKYKYMQALIEAQNEVKVRTKMNEQGL